MKDRWKVFRNLHVLSYMQFFAKKNLISVCLIFSMLANVVAQEKEFSFTWLDRFEKKMAGKITANLIPQTADDLYQLEFTVTWFNQEGKPVTDVSQMPYLCLSKWDFDKLPEQNIRCTLFDQKIPSSLVIQSSGRLDLQVLNGYEGDIELTSRFQYALTRQLYESGKSEKISLMGFNALKMHFQLKSRRQVAETDIIAKGKVKTTNAIRNSGAMRTVADNYQKIQLQVKDFMDRKSINELDPTNYIKNLEGVSASIDRERSLLNPDSLPADSIQLYRDQFNQLYEYVLGLRTALMLRISPLKAGMGSYLANSLRNNDSLRSLIRIRIEPAVHNQVDSLQRIAKDQKLMALEVSTLMTDLKVRHPDHTKVSMLFTSSI